MGSTEIFINQIAQTNIYATEKSGALKASGCEKIFQEKVSDGRWDRPELHKLLEHLRTGDSVVVWKLDRLSRSLKERPGAGLIPPEGKAGLVAVGLN